MPEPFAMDAGVQYAFAPSPELVEGVLHRIHVVFESSDGRGCLTSALKTRSEESSTAWDARAFGCRAGGPTGWRRTTRKGWRRSRRTGR